MNIIVQSLSILSLLILRRLMHYTRIEVLKLVPSLLFPHFSQTSLRNVRPFACALSDVWRFLRKKRLFHWNADFKAQRDSPRHVYIRIRVLRMIRHISFFVFFLTRQGQSSYARVVHLIYHLGFSPSYEKNNINLFSMFYKNRALSLMLTGY